MKRRITTETCLTVARTVNTSNVRDITFNGGEFTILADGRISGVSEHTFKDGRLTINGANTPGHTGSSGTFSTTVVNGMRISNDGEIKTAPGQKRLRINGHLVDLARLSSITANVAVTKYSITLLDADIRYLTVNSDSHVIICPSLLNVALSVSVFGGGHIRLTEAKHFSVASWSITGSGSIDGDNSTVDSAFINVTGSGCICGMTVNVSGNASVVGSGTIRVFEAAKGVVTGKRVGSGTIRVTPAKKSG